MNQIIVLSILFVFSLVSCTVTLGIPAVLATTEEEEEKEEGEEEEEAEEEEEEEKEEEDSDDTDSDPPSATVASVDPDDVDSEGIDPDDVGSDNLITPEDIDSQDIDLDDIDADRIDSGDVETRGVFGEITSNTRSIDPVPQFSNARMIAMDLSRLTPTEIRSYPTSQLSSSDLDSAFQHLTPVNLEKVLMNTPLEDLRTIEGKLTPLTFEQILDRLDEPNRTEVLNRLSSPIP